LFNVTLSQEERDELYFIGLYCGFYGGTIDRKAIKNQVQNTDSDSVSLELELKHDEFPFFIIPNTFDANEQGKFELTFYSTEKLIVEKLS